MRGVEGNPVEGDMIVTSRCVGERRLLGRREVRGISWKAKVARDENICDSDEKGIQMRTPHS
jgi:hypothetical protein